MKQFKPSVTAETKFARALRKVARYSGHIVEAHTDGDRLRDEAGMQKALREYSELIDLWARNQAAKMLEQVGKSNKRAYRSKSKELGKRLAMVSESQVGTTAAGLMFEQVELIKSLPLRAGMRAQELARKAVFQGTRADEIAKMLADSQDVSESEAMVIARTEVARANTAIMRARAQAVGSGQYRWHNSGDESVRESHLKYKGKKLQGMIFSWDNPPTLDDGMTGHPGTFPNCRCFPEPIFDGE